MVSAIVFQFIANSLPMMAIRLRQFAEEQARRARRPGRKAR